MKQVICDNKAKICESCNKLIMPNDSYWRVERSVKKFNEPIDLQDVKVQCNYCFSKSCKKQEARAAEILPEDMFPDYKSTDNELFFEG